MDEAARGASALASKDFHLAITHYNKAITTNPAAVDYYIKRSTAYTRLSPADHASALKDAEVAVVLAAKRGKRELLWQSQLRRGIALFGLERWGDAQACFNWVGKLNKDEKSLKIWTIKVEGKLKGLEEADERRRATVKESPDVELPTEEVKKVENPEVKTVHENVAISGVDTTQTEAKLKAEGVQTPAGKIRHEWYQTIDNVVVTLFAKGVPKDKATIEIEPNSLTISFPMPNGSDFQFSLDPLYSIIDASTSTSKILSTKVEFTLKKSQPGKWTSLESSERPRNDSKKDDESSSTAMKDAFLSGPVNSSTHSAPSYPTSSKSGPKNWDKLATELTQKPTKKNKDGEEEGGDGGMDDYEGGDPVNGFFQSLYQNADPNTRRAMIKSFQESNGTALSTNWDEVGKGPVETSPPDGMEAKKW